MVRRERWPACYAVPVAPGRYCAAANSVSRYKRATPVPGLPRSAGAEPDEHVGAIGQVEVAHPRVHQPRFRRPRSPTHDMVIAEPRLRVVRVRACGEPRIGRERRRGPFPDVAEHMRRAGASRGRRDRPAVTTIVVRLTTDG